MPIKKLFIGLIIGALISGMTVYAVETKYKAEEVKYKETTVKDALDKLYEIKDNVLGPTSNNVYHSGLRSTQNSVSIDLNKGKYICNVVYSGTSATGSTYSTYKNAYVDGSGYFEINGCDTLNIINETKKTKYGNTLYANVYLSSQHVQTIFSCDINESKTITAINKGYSEVQGLPLIVEINCTEIG